MNNLDAEKFFFDMSEIDINSVISIVKESTSIKKNYKDIESKYKSLLYKLTIMQYMSKELHLLYKLNSGSITVIAQKSCSFLSNNPEIYISVMPVKNDKNISDDVFYTECNELLRSEIEKMEKFSDE